MSNSTDSYGSIETLAAPYTLNNIWAELALCMTAFIVASVSFILINSWTLKNLKLRTILYISSSSSILIGSLWLVELLCVSLGYKFYTVFWIFRYSRLWVAFVTERLLISVYFILFLILISKLSMSQVQVSRLVIVSVLLGSIFTGESVYLLLKYPSTTADGRYTIDAYSDMTHDFVFNWCDGIIIITRILEYICFIGSYFYTTNYLKSRPNLLKYPVIISAYSMIRRLLPIYLVLLFPATLNYLLSFMSTWLPSSFQESEFYSLTTALSFYFHWFMLSFWPILIKWAIQPPSLAKTHHAVGSHDQIRTRRVIPERSSALEHRLIVHVNTAAIQHDAIGSGFPSEAQFVVANDRDEERELQGNEGPWDIFAQFERTAANFLGYAAPDTAVVVANILAQNALDAESSSQVAPGAPGPSQAFFGHQGAFGESSEVDFEALEAIMAGHYRTRNGREPEIMFEMDSMYNRDGKNLLPDDLLG